MKVNRTNISLFLSVSVIALISMIGCSGEKQPDGLPSLYPVTILVTQEGQPMVGASVALTVPDGSLSWVIGGITGADGKATLRTQGKYDGAPAGKYNVQISKNVYEEDVKVIQHVEDAYMSAKNTPIKVEITKETKLLEVDAGPAVRIEKPMLR